MKLHIHIIHENQELNLSIKSTMERSYQYFFEYIKELIGKELTKHEIIFIKELMRNNFNLQNNMKRLSVIINVKLRTLYRIRNLLVKNEIIQVSNNYITKHSNFIAIETKFI